MHLDRRCRRRIVFRPVFRSVCSVCFLACHPFRVYRHRLACHRLVCHHLVCHHC